MVIRYPFLTCAEGRFPVPIFYQRITVGSFAFNYPHFVQVILCFRFRHRFAEGDYRRMYESKIRLIFDFRCRTPSP